MGIDLFREVSSRVLKRGGHGLAARPANAALAIGVAVALGASTAIALPSGRLPPRSGHVSIAEPALAAPEPSGSPSPQPQGSPTSVRLPLFGGDQATGAIPIPRPGSALRVPSVGLQVAVDDYGDCTGDTPMTRSDAVHFLCTPAAVVALVGHNPGVFSPLLHTQPGDRVSYLHDGVADVYVIGAGHRVSPQEAAAYTQDGSYAHMVLATCAEPDSSAYWVYLATPLGSSGGSQGSPAPSPSASSPRPSPQPSPTPSPSGGGGGPLPLPLPSPPI